VTQTWRVTQCIGGECMITCMVLLQATKIHKGAKQRGATHYKTMMIGYMQ